MSTTGTSNVATFAFHSISKSYGSVRALDDVSLVLESGEIHALLGENGAGKSTLLAVIAGKSAADAGRIEIDGKLVQIKSTRDATAHGIATVFQHFTLVPPMTVAENLQLSQSATRSVSTAELAHNLAELGMDVPLDERVETLGVGTRQQVEIAKALLLRPRLLLLDEPTSVLAGPE